MALLNYTTKIPAEQTIGEIQKMLSNHGVMAMMTEYDGPHVSAVSFKMDIAGKPMGFRMPCNWKAVYEIFTEKAGKRDIWDSARKARVLEERKQQAIRTAWRIIKSWTEAQLALIEVNMVTIQQVFLPYSIMKDGRTLSEHIEDNPSFLLEDGK
jgi:hypothetical protein